MSDMCSIYSAENLDPKRCPILINNVMYKGAMCVKTQCWMKLRTNQQICMFHSEMLDVKRQLNSRATLTMFNPNFATPDQNFDHTLVSIQEAALRMMDMNIRARHSLNKQIQVLRNSNVNADMVQRAMRANELMNAQLATRTSQITELSNKIANLERARDASPDASEEAIKRLEAEKAATQSELNDAKGRFAQTAQRVRELSDQLANVQQEKLNQDEQIRLLKSSSVTLAQHQNILEEANNRVSAQVKLYNELNAKYATGDAAAAMELHKANTNNAQAQLAALGRELSNLKGELATANSNRETYAGEHAELETLRAKIVDLEREHDEADLMLANADRKATSAAAKSDLRAGTISRLEKLLEKANAITTEKTAAAATFEADLETCQTKTKQLLIQIQELEAAGNRMQTVEGRNLELQRNVEACTAQVQTSGEAARVAEQKVQVAQAETKEQIRIAEEAVAAKAAAEALAAANAKAVVEQQAQNAQNKDLAEELAAAAAAQRQRERDATPLPPSVQTQVNMEDRPLPAAARKVPGNARGPMPPRPKTGGAGLPPPTQQPVAQPPAPPLPTQQAPAQPPAPVLPTQQPVAQPQAPVLGAPASAEAAMEAQAAAGVLSQIQSETLTGPLNNAVESGMKAVYITGRSKKERYMALITGIDSATGMVTIQIEGETEQRTVPLDTIYPVIKKGMKLKIRVGKTKNGSQYFRNIPSAKVTKSSGTFRGFATLPEVKYSCNNAEAVDVEGNTVLEPGPCNANKATGVHYQDILAIL